MTGARHTLPGAPLVHAPGKAFLVGEYAVLEQGVAVLAAVSRYAVGQYVAELEPSSPVIAETDRRAREALGELASALPAGAALVDTAQFEQGGIKLGLGSSAAAAVAATGALFERAGVSVAGHQELLYAVADAGHRAAQGGVGSGADVAVAVHGGFIQFLRPEGGVPAITSLAAPGGLSMVIFWTGKAARTPALIEAVSAFATRAPGPHRALLGELRATAARFVTAFAENDAPAVVEAADAYGRLMATLGDHAEVPIVTPALAAASSLARSLGGAAKPSGAGGGDIGVAFFADPEARAAFTTRCPDGVLVLDIRLGAVGANRRLPSGIETFKKD
jgi:phosphomevalonate kinase